MNKHRKHAVNIRTSIAILLSISAFLTHAQFELTEVNVVCPCSLRSENNQTAQLQFSIKNNLDVLVDELRATVAIAGEFTDPEHSYKTSAFLDTVAITKTLQPYELAEISATIDMGVIPNGSFYFELVLHDAEEIKRSTTVDSIWFAGEITIPSSGLDLSNADYLVDTDGDGIDDLNERLENSDPNNPDDRPGPPIIDVLVLYTNLSLNNLNLEASLIVQHHLATSEYMFASSSSSVRFRTVGLLTHDDVSDLADTGTQGALQAIPTTAKLALRDEYNPDFILVFRGDNDGLCGIAEAIGGFGGRGFIHPHERGEYTEIYLDTLSCSTMTTAHEIGHLMGLGHSYNQGSLGTFHWSRGHGVEGRFGTIMTYARSAYRATRVDLFSNPELDCQGIACGISHHNTNEDQSANAALSLNITKYQFARNRIPDPELDVDEDGRGADIDVFPLDPTEWEDSDGDSHGDNSDEFPDDPLEWADTDGDGIGDNSDPDIDNDGRLNYLDAAPFDAETQTIPLLKIVSDRDGDRFGATIVRIHDFDSDGLDDLAVAAPQNTNAEGVATGTVYLFSFADFTEVPDFEVETTSSVQLSSLLSAGTAWQIHAALEEEHLGQQLKLIQRNISSDSSPELLIRGLVSSYVLSLDQNDLNALDGADGSMDRQITLANCSIGLKCLQLMKDPEFQLSDIVDAGDIDNDDMTDLAFLGKDSELNQALLYVLTRSGIENALNTEDVDDVTVVDVWEEDDASLLIHTDGIRGNLSVVNIGNITGGTKPELGIGLPGRGGQPARFYVLSTDQFAEIAVLDSDGDRRIAIDDFVRILSTYRVSNELDRGFASGVQVVNDVDGDELLDILLWDDRTGSLILSTLTIRVLDIQDSQLDASVTIQEDVEETEGVWALNNLAVSEQRHRSVLFSNDTNVGDGLVAGFSRDFMYASLKDLNYLDDPTAGDLNGSINLPARNRYDNIYRIRFPYGPMGRPAYGGIASLGDLDGDELLDFTIAVHSNEIDRHASEVYVVFSSALKQLDEADDEVDHFVALHNDFRDTDEDGMPNIFDIDDDGDGLRDRLDTYPLLKDFQYDADFDGVANKLDAFPLLANAQFDFDGDGINDRWDPDVDGDGIFNPLDEFPRDTDNDGLDNDVDLDDDADGILDVDDIGPLDTNNDGINNQEDPDDDSDGIEDADDEFPLDTDNDGTNNDLDADDDGDGVMDIDDAFPLDATETLDTDGDGFGDNADLFVEDATEWSDHDEDGIGDNADLDDDNDGVDDLTDAYPLDPEE